MTASAERVLALARAEIGLHPAVRRVGSVTPGRGFSSIEVDIDVQLASRFAAEGQSPDGVRALETLRLDFLDGYPVRGCRPSLRPDFSRAFPHVMPALTADGRPIPCVVDGRSADYIAGEGLTAYLDQCVVWLRRAAHRELIDPEQGWEPIRRDECRAVIVADAEALRGLTSGSTGLALLQTEYLLDQSGPELSLNVQVGRTTKLHKAFGVAMIARGVSQGRSVALVLWPPRRGEFPIQADYAPETVTDFASFKEAARHFGLARLEPALDQIASLDWTIDGSLPVTVFMMVRRPCKIIGQGSDVELIPYVVVGRIRSGRLTWSDAAVVPAAHLESISPKLLARLSGHAGEQRRWTLLGCGSLGSKIALHRARAGSAPELVVDRSVLRPHNAARHGLYPEEDLGALGYTGSKAEALGEVLGRVGGSTRASTADVVDILDQAHFAARGGLMVDSTGSLVVREVLARRSSEAPRGIEVGLYGRGRLGVAAIEGSRRNPDSGELAGALFKEALRRPDLETALFGKGSRLERVSIGEGCGSLTMVMDDSTLSLQAAAMAREIDRLAGALPGSGELILWTDGEEALRRERVEVGPFTRVTPVNERSWRVTIAGDVRLAIEAEVAAHRGVETGGLLIGRTSAISQSIYVLDHWPAPPDSVRSSDAFILGVEGVTEAREALQQRTDGGLHVVGTWHSHLGGAQPSLRDRETACELGDASPHAATLLIRGADGWAALLADPLEAQR